MSNQPPRYCTSCGAELQHSSKFCTKCGARINRQISNQISNQEIEKLSLKATELFNARKIEEAIPLLDKLIAAAPNSDVYLLLRGQCDFFSEKYSEALQFFTKALELKPNGIECNQMMGLTLFKMNRFSEATPFLEKTLSMQYDSNIESLLKYCANKRGTKEDKSKL